MDSDEESYLSEEVIPVSTRSKNELPKVAVYVPPRIDSESYQCDIPDLVDGPPEGTNLVATSWYDSTVQISTTTKQENAIKAFLAFTRNIFEPGSLKDGETWDTITADIPLEGDGEMIEYLSKRDYDVERAKFNLVCDLGFGKDYVSSAKYAQMTHFLALILNISTNSLKLSVSIVFEPLYTFTANCHGFLTSIPSHLFPTHIL